MNKQPEEINHQTLSENHLPVWFDGMTAHQRKEYERLAGRVERLEQMVSTISLGMAEQREVAKALKQAHRLLDYKRPYNISVVGMSGVGKSTLINALIGRDLLISLGGVAATGTIVTVEQTVADRGESPVQRALVYYHTPFSLSEEVKELCQALHIEPVFTHSTPSLVDIDETLRLIQGNCPQCGVEKKRPDAKFCAGCRYQFQMNKSSAESAEFVMLKDLLETAVWHQTLLQQGPNPEEYLLNSNENIRHLQALMNEESEINKKGSQKRIVPLIRRIEYEISIEPQPEQQGLAYIKLTDTPGTGALTPAHRKLLREQLDPRKTDALILVMKPDRPPNMIEEMVPLIDDMLMFGLKPEDRHIIAKRIFLVVNKTDEIPPENLEKTKRNLRQGVEQVGDKIIPGFCGDFSDHVFYDMKAQPALLAELIRSYPEASERWLQGQEEPHFRFNKDYYIDVAAKAQRQYQNVSREEAVLRWSEIGTLQERLKEFLMNSRWEQDLKQAQALYYNAREKVAKQVNENWKGITGNYFSPNPEEDREHFDANQVLRYAGILEENVAALKERFANAYQLLLRQEQDGQALAYHLKQVVQSDIQHKIINYTETEDFKNQLMSQAIDPVTGEIFNNAGAPQALVTLNQLIYEWFDGHIERVTNTMMDQFRTELSNARMESALRNAYYEIPSYDDDYLHGKNGKLGYRNIIEQVIYDKYKQACRGAILYQLITRKVINEILSDADFQSAASQARGPLGSESSSSTVNSAHTNNTADKLVAKIRQTYIGTHRKLIDNIPPHLAHLFFYHLIGAQQELADLVRRLRIKLLGDIQTKKGPLYEKMQQNESGQAARRAKVYQYWQELEVLK